MTVNDRLRVAKVVLHILAEKSPQRWSALEKAVTKESPTYARFQGALRWLLRQGYIEKTARGMYAITEKGEYLLKVI